MKTALDGSRSLLAAGLLLGAVAIMSCSTDRYRRDVIAICTAMVASGGSEADEWRRIDDAVAIVEPALQTPEGRRLVGRLREASADPAAILAREAARAGVVPCSMADTMDAAEERVRYRHDVTMLCGYELDAVGPDQFLSERGRRLHERLSSLPPDLRRAALMEAAKALAFTGCAMAEGKP